MFVKTKAICYGYFQSVLPKIKLKDRCAMQQRAEKMIQMNNIRKENAVLFLNYISHKNMHNTNK